MQLKVTNTKKWQQTIKKLKLSIPLIELSKFGDILEIITSLF